MAVRMHPMRSNFRQTYLSVLEFAGVWTYGAQTA